MNNASMSTSRMTTSIIATGIVDASNIVWSPAKISNCKMRMTCTSLCISFCICYGPIYNRWPVLKPASLFNPLITKLSSWNFNLVNADHFSREYLVCLLCYWSQICVLLPQWVAAIAHTQVGQYAPPTSKVKPIKCKDLVKFCSKLVLWGWLLKSTHK